MDIDNIQLPMGILTVPEHENDLPSQFGDDDALLSVASPSAEFGVVNTASVAASSKRESNSVTSSIASGLKSSELRIKSSVDSNMLKYQREDSITSQKMIDFNLNTMGLIGREEEISILRSSLDRILQQSKSEATVSDEDDLDVTKNEMALLGGPSGVGKSSIVKEIKVAMEREKVGFFVGTKFSMHACEVPYSGVCEALGMTCQHLCRELQDSVPTVRRTLEKELGEESSLLCQLVPELNRIMYDRHYDCEEAAVGDVDMEELEMSMDRLRYAFRILMRTLSSVLNPLVLFLDDLHWADVSSLQVLDYMISDTENQNPLMIIGCYRSDDVDENSLLYNKIQSLRDKSSRFKFCMTEIEVAPFAASDVEKIVTTAIGSPSDEETFKLSEVCVKRTLGNPFFIIEFLKMLRNEGLIAYDESSKKWTWDLDRIEDATMSTANVVVLLQERMRKLSGQVQSFLQYAAHLGSSFSEETIKIIWQTYGRRVAGGKVEPLAKLLELAVNDNYLEQLDATHYRWVHDKVQEAALYLAGTLRETQCLDIGTSLYYLLQPKQLEEDLFNVVDLINKGNINRRTEFAAVNLRAAEKARNISAFQAASKYAARGIELLNDSCWSHDRHLTLKLHTIGAEMEQALGNVTAAERYSSEVLSRTELGAMDTLPLKLARASTLSTVELKFNESVACCLDVLKELGYKLFWSRKSVKMQAILTLVWLIRRVKKLPTNYFGKVKMMEDDKQKGIATLVSRMAVSSYLAGDVMLSVLCTCKLVEISLDHGVNEFSAKSLSGLASATVIVQEDFKAATKFNEMALSLIKSHRQIHSGYTMYNVCTTCLFWVKPVDECLPVIWDAYSHAMRSGDAEFSSWSLYTALITTPFLYGKPLSQALANCPTAMRQFEEAAQSQQIMLLKIVWQVMLNLHDSSSHEPQKLEGEIFDESKNTGTDPIHVATVQVNQSYLLLFYGEYTVAADMAIERGDLYERVLLGRHITIFEAFHRGLALYAAALQTNKKKYKKEARRVRKKLTKKIVAISNHEFNYFKTMLDAEQFAVEKNFGKADRYYDEAIQSAISRGHLHHAGLFFERHADFLMRQLSNRTRSNKQLKQAVVYYKQWGANRKVKALESKMAGMDMQ